MIELINASKIYNAKKGNSTVALDNVNLKLSGAGLIFITGKSGSGKSTMLNVIGGLDSLTSGNLVIDDKDISKFSDDEFDSYRNTYIGFIFQEFNVLDEYNVYENIELALKLQNKYCDKKDIDALLEKLGIANLGTRNINELSGGQKQRVAIARALLKKPQVILADEPTGNLDKASSEQIFNILKSISKDTLVIVVSHDKEAANTYADRIINLSDGVIISDSGSTNIVSCEKISFTKAKLPFSYAFKMSLTSLKQKPFKLFMTIFLTSWAFIFMAIAINLALFDEERFISNMMKDNNDYTYYVQYKDFDLDGEESVLELNEKNFSDISSITTNSKLNKVYFYRGNNDLLAFEYGENKESNFYNYTPSSFSFVEVEDDRLFNNIIGDIPVNNNEVVVHKYLADCIIYYGIYLSDGTLYKPTSYRDIVNDKKALKFGSNSIRIVGIMNDDKTLYQSDFKLGYFKNKKKKEYYYNNYVDKGSTIYVKGFINNIKIDSDKEHDLSKMAIGYGSITKKFIHNLKILDKEISVLTKDGFKKIDKLKDNEVIISINDVKKINSFYNDGLNKYSYQNLEKKYADIIEEFTIDFLKEHIDIGYLSLRYNNDNADLSFVGITLEDNNYISEDILDNFAGDSNKAICNSVLIYDDNIPNVRLNFSKMKFDNYPLLYKNTTGTFYTYHTSHFNDIYEVIAIYKYMMPLILIVSLIFMLFAFFLFSNFIGISISYYKKEIGILRALGTCKSDIIKIFGYESLIIGITSFIFAILGWLFVSFILNRTIFNKIYYTLNCVVLSPMVPLILLIFVIIVSLLITISSIKKLVKIKPIDAILNK